MDINDPFIQKALRGDCGKFLYKEVKAFVERNSGEIKLLNPKSKNKNKMCIVVEGVDRRPRLPFIKIEYQHHGEPYVDRSYIRDLIRDLIVAGHISQEDIDE